MPLPSYGLLIGTLTSYDNDGTTGHYLHALLHLREPDGTNWRCAVDVNGATAPIEYAVLPVDAAGFASVAAMPDGYAALATDATSGALDVVRDPRLHAPVTAWQTVTGNVADETLRPYARAATRIFVFGERYDDRGGSGMHNIHVNQGDTDRKRFRENGVWQDGGLVLLGAGGVFTAFLIRFTTQTTDVDDAGQPAGPATR